MLRFVQALSDKSFRASIALAAKCGPRMEAFSRYIVPLSNWFKVNVLTLDVCLKPYSRYCSRRSCPAWALPPGARRGQFWGSFMVDALPAWKQPETLLYFKFSQTPSFLRRVLWRYAQISSSSKHRGTNGIRIEEGVFLFRAPGDPTKDTLKADTSHRSIGVG